MWITAGIMSRPKSWLAAVPRGVEAKLLEEEAGGEDVNAHRGQGVVRIAGNRLGLRRLLLEAR